mmetsp:Transcript_21934/g.75383  ORF Transcript_21934/g.75383 Transcript_21934/m.75383 type:complete len:620 (+) Transcript_21934:62-1921(+)
MGQISSICNPTSQCKPKDFPARGRTMLTLDDLSGDPPVFGAESTRDVGDTGISPDAEDLLDAALGVSGVGAPANLGEAMDATVQATWLPAIRKQTDAYKLHDTMHPVLRSTVPAGVRVKRLGINFRLKRDGSVKSRIYLAELRGSRPDVAPGQAGPHVATHSSPSPGYTAVKFMAAHAAHFGNILLADDTIDAYLKGAPRDEPFYAFFPANWRLYMLAEFGNDPAQWPYDPATHVCCITGNIPGALDAGAIWRDAIHPVITSLGFVVTPLSEALYVRREPDGTTSGLMIWTDDTIVSATAARAAEITGAISARFASKGCRILGSEDADMLALDIVANPDGGYSIHMTTYETAVVAKLGYKDATAAKTPLPALWHADSTEDPEASHGAPAHKFHDPRVAIGLLTFNAYILRADYSFALSSLSGAVGVWVEKHDRALGRTIRYLKGRIGAKITWPGKFPITTKAYVDASFGNELFDGNSTARARSRIAGVLYLGPTPIWYFTARTKTTPLSTAEAELLALVRLLRGLVILRVTIMMLFGIKDLPPTYVYEDNMAVVQMLRKRVISGRSRHVRVAIGYVLDVLDAGHAIVSFVGTKDQLANGLTKAETKDEHARTFAAFFSE